jgi:hypothetical protein
MKNLLPSFIILAFIYFRPGKPADPIPVTPLTVEKNDNYTVQYLILLNDKAELLMQKNSAGWHTLAKRSTENQSVKESLDSMAASLGLVIGSIKLGGMYTYKFDGLPDHRQMSYRTHYTAMLTSGKLIQPRDTSIQYYWVPAAEAIRKITFESLRLETDQILRYPNKIWGGSFLITWKDSTFVGSKVLETPYPLN